MLLEIKTSLTVICIIFLAIALSFILFINMLLAFLIIMAIGLYIFGDLFLCWQITKNDCIPQIDRTPSNKETMVLITLTKDLRIINTEKGPEGKREFMFNKTPATVINKGDYNIRLPNGNRAFLAHEGHDENIHPAETIYAEKLANKHRTTDLKTIHAKVLEEQKEGQEE